MKRHYTVIRTAEDWRLCGKDANEPNQFLERVNLRGLAEGSLRTYAFDLAVALNWMLHSGKTVENMRRQDLYDFVRDQRQGACAVTINRRLRLFHRYLAQARPDEFEPRDFIRSRRRRPRPLPYMKEPRLVKLPLTDRKVRDIVARLRTNRDRAIVALMWAAGLRIGEVLSLRLPDLDWDNGTILVHGKGDRERSMPFSGPVAQLISRYLAVERPSTAADRVFVVLKGQRRGNPMTYAGARRLFRYWRGRLNLPEAHTHRFRHTFAANMIRHGVSVPMLMRLLGHTWAETTMRYVHFDDREIRKHYEKALAELGTITGSTT